MLTLKVDGRKVDVLLLGLRNEFCLHHFFCLFNSKIFCIGLFGFGCVCQIVWQVYSQVKKQCKSCKIHFYNQWRATQKNKLAVSPVLEPVPTDQNKSAERTLASFMHNLPQSSENSSDGKPENRMQSARLVLNLMLRNPGLRLVVKNWGPVYGILYHKALKIQVMERKITENYGRERIWDLLYRLRRGKVYTQLLFIRYR